MNKKEIISKNKSDIYNKLTRHFNKMPVRMPASNSGNQLILLKHFFSPKEAEIALGMDFTMQTAETICKRLNHQDVDKVKNILMQMVQRGSIIYRKEGKLFALVPFIVGMYEFQAKRVSKDFFKTCFNYIKEKYAFEFLTTKKPQVRVIPVNEKIENKGKIATYDEYESLINNAGDRIVIIECICRTAQDYAKKPCTISDRRELCLALNDYADVAIEKNWGRKISTNEALEISKQNQKEGLILQCANDQNPNFICACCKDCCGLLAMYKAIPHPAEYVASNYSASVNDDCIGCTICQKICPMDAIDIKDKKAFVKKERCIGCGVCTLKCPKNAIKLINRKITTIPPKTVDDLYEDLAKSKYNIRNKMKLAIRYVKSKIKQKF